MFTSELWHKPAAGATGFYTHQIANSCRFDGSSSEAVRTLNTTATNRDKYTFSTWIKRSTISANQYIFGGETDNVNYDVISFASDNTLRIVWQRGGSSGEVWAPNLYRDTSAWMHLVVQYDTTQSTASDRVKIYINGVQSTLSESRYSGFISQNEDLELNANGNEVTVGSSYTYNGFTKSYMAQTAGIDGSIVAIGDLGESKNGVWIPKDLSGLTFGNNGFLLDYASSSDMGNDVSGNNNDFTTANISTHDQMLDSPTFNSDSNGGNFCTYNPLQEQGGAQDLMALSEGNLHAQSETNDKYSQIIGNMGVKTGKWYIEWYIKDDGYPSFAVGWHHTDRLGLFNGNGGLAAIGNMQYMGYFTGSNVYITNFGNTATADPQVAHSSFTNQGAPATDDIIMCAIDMDAGKCWWGINGVWGDIGSGTGNPATGANASATWTIADYTDHIFPFTIAWANPDTKIIMNCGQEGTFAGSTTAGGNADDTGYGNFKYDVPAGFLALCSGNLPVADAVDPAQTSSNFPQKLFGAKTYTGTGSSNAITGVGFQPDWTWIKERGGANDHKLTDSTRGVTKSIESNTTAAEATDSNGLTAFGTDGFTVGSDAVYNNSSDTYVSWNWRANGGTTSSNGNGSITSTVQVDPSGGFSIVNYTGYDSTWDNLSTVGHGLSAAPNCILSKTVDADQSEVYHSAVGAGGGSNASYNSLRLDTNGGLYTNQTYKTWGGVMPTSTVYTVNGNNANKAGTVQRAYCFANTEGYIKSGSYEGNGNVDGTFVYTGFRPAFIMTKSIDSTSDWQMFDDKRVGYNVDNNELQANEADAEVTTDMIDILSNGFKMRIATDPNVAETYVYLAIAHNPFKYATAR